MKLKFVVAVVTVLVLCYFGAGAPAPGLLFKPSVIGAGLALKPVTYHWMNPLDRAIPGAELRAGRFYVLLIAAISLLAGLFVFRAGHDKRGFIFVLAWSIALLVVLIYAQVRAFYMVG